MQPFKNYVFVFIILGCGVLAGIYDAHVELENIVETPKGAWHIWRISILRSIIAAFTVPLFLTIINSKLIDISEGLTLQKALVLTGFCLIAAVNADKFLDTVFNNSISSVEKMAKQNNALQKKVLEQQKENNDLQNILLVNQNLQKRTVEMKEARTNNKEFLKQYANYDLNKNQWNIVKLLSANTNNLFLDSIKSEVDTVNFEKEIKQLEQKNLFNV